jgi:hypothetical protein
LLRDTDAELYRREIVAETLGGLGEVPNVEQRDVAERPGTLRIDWVPSGLTHRINAVELSKEALGDIVLRPVDLRKALLGERTSDLPEWQELVTVWTLYLLLEKSLT